MSEFEPRFEQHEHSKLNPEQIAERQREIEAARERAAEQAERERDSIEVIRDRLEHAIDKVEQKPSARHETTAKHSRAPIGKHLQHRSREQTLKAVRKQLPQSQRVMSKIIHQAQIEAVSNAAESTVARPSGLLFGGLCSALCSLLVLYICRHYGYEYNFFIGIASFAGGFAIGVIGEALLKLRPKHRKQRRSHH